MSATGTLKLIRAYYDAFNAGDTAAMAACLADGIEHHVNQGEVRKGKSAFAEFSAHMTNCYKEQLQDVVIMANDRGTRAAAEFVVHGSYIATDTGLPEAKGQKYVLPAGAFFAIESGLIRRVTTYYNLADWLRQVGGAPDDGDKG